MVIVEEWREIHDGYYEVSNLGNVRRAKAGVATFVGRPVMPIATGHGYSQVQLGGNRSRRAYVHHLVAEAFLGFRPPKHVINHLDADRTNNARSNLEYITYSENAAHAVRTVKRRRGPTKPAVIGPGVPRGDKHWSKNKPERIARGIVMPHCKLTPEIVAAVRSRAAGGETQKSLALEVGISVAQMSRIIRRKRWTYL